MTSLDDLFGEISESEDGDDALEKLQRNSMNFNRSEPFLHENVKGLHIFRSCFTLGTCNELTKFAEREMGLNDEKIEQIGQDQLAESLKNIDKNVMNQLMYFGTLPPLLNSIAKSLQTLPIPCLSQSMRFNQIIVNYYPPGKGIKEHVDLMRFQDGIFGLSVKGQAIMWFRKRQRHAESQYGEMDPNECHCNSPNCPMTSEVDTQQDSTRFPILLNPGDVYVMTGESRWHWTHCIDETSQEFISQPTHQESVVRGDRLSFTFRRLVPQ